MLQIDRGANLATETLSAEHLRQLVPDDPRSDGARHTGDRPRYAVDVSGLGCRGRPRPARGRRGVPRPRHPRQGGQSLSADLVHGVIVA